MEYWSNVFEEIVPIHKRNKHFFLRTHYSIFPPFHSSIGLVKSCDFLKNAFLSKKSDASNCLHLTSRGFYLLLGSDTTAMYLYCK